MKDAIGQPLVEGDLVAFTPPYGARITLGNIKSFTPKMLRVAPLNKDTWWYDEKGTLRDPESTIKLTEQYKAFATEHPELLV